MKKLALILLLTLTSGCLATLRDRLDRTFRPDRTPKSDIPAGTVWLEQNIESWPITTNLEAEVTNNHIIMRYDKSSTWPAGNTRARDGGPLVGNAWVIANVDGTWYAETWEWMRQGQQMKARTSLTGPGHLRSRMLRDWEPASGETIYIMVSTFVRGPERTSNERSAAIPVVWP